MPLSKARDRERKRLSRLESKKVQPKIAGLEIKGNKIIGVQPRIYTDYKKVEPKIYTEYDADGNPIPEWR